MFRIALALVFVAQAQTLEVIALKYRTADQVLDTLRPFVEPGGTLTGQGNQLILRVSPANLDEIRRALDAIDRPSRRLQISVRFDDALESSRRDLAVGGSVSNSGVRVEGSARDSQRSRDERVDQRLQVLEGGRATIFTGTTGFEVQPRLADREVVLDIVQQRDSRQSLQSAATTVRAPLGQWVEIGSTVRMAVQDNRSIGSASRVHRDESRQVWVKVEALPN
jgi:type II secretory pathway component GspD/PulD (secretin)